MIKFLDVLDKRIKNINEYFTFSLYCNVCRSLFEKHKLLFAFLLTVRILMNQKKIQMVSLDLFYTYHTKNIFHREIFKEKILYFVFVV